MTVETTDQRAERRPRLSRERVLQAAVELADREGTEALTMRNVAHELGVEAMSLYYHVANKDDLLDGIVETVVGEINEAVAGLEPQTPDDWRPAMRRRILAAREVLLSHPWAPQMIESRASMSPAAVLYFESLVGLMRAGGFSYDLAHHALHTLGSRALGFNQELFQPTEAADGDQSTEVFEQMADRLPNLVGMLAEITHDDGRPMLGWCDNQTEFEFGLDLLLEGLDRRRKGSQYQS